MLFISEIHTSIPLSAVAKYVPIPSENKVLCENIQRFDSLFEFPNRPDSLAELQTLGTLCVTAPADSANVHCSAFRGRCDQPDFSELQRLAGYSSRIRTSDIVRTLVSGGITTPTAFQWCERLSNSELSEYSCGGRSPVARSSLAHDPAQVASRSHM